jgi:hypothetical protein
MGLSFLTPMLLGGAALVAVPLVLHLLMRRKPVKLEFPALRFLQQRAVTNRRSLRLSHVFLLLLRMAALVFLAFALARPVLRGAGWLADGEGPVAAAFVFDTAPRMLLREGNRTRLEQAADMAKTLFAKLPAESRVAVLDTSGGAAAFAPTIAAATARIERLTAASPAASLSQTLADAVRLVAGSGMARREIYLFTDCSQGAWDNAPQLDLAESHPDTSLLVVDVGATAARNFAIDGVELSSDRIPAGSTLGITVATRRTGTDANRSVSVDMIGENGQATRRAVKPGVWQPTAGGQIDFEITGLEPGIRQGRVVIDGDDDLEADNARSFTVEVGAPARILVAAPAPASRTGLFLAQAIAPAALAKAGKAAFEITLVDSLELASLAWDDFRGIVLVDPPPLPPATWELLGQWVAAGRGLVVWLGPRAVDATRFNSPASQRVLGGGIVRVWRAAGGENFLAPAALDHPILAAFRRVGDAVPWQDFPVTRHWEFELAPAGQPAEPATDRTADRATGTAAATAHAVADYRNGMPAVIEHALGQGMVVTVTTPVSQSADDPEAWNTLATGFEPWPFVMLANETLLRAIDTSDDLNIVAGRPASLHMLRREGIAAFVRPPSGDEFPVAIDQARGTITVTATQLPGNYSVRAGGAAAGLATGFSATLEPSATDFTRVNPDSLAAVWGPGHRLARTEAELVRDVNLERVGAELYGWIILLAAAVMAADWIVANRFYAPRESTAIGAGPAAEFAEAAEEAASTEAKTGAALPRTPGGSAGMPPPLPVAVEQEAGA